MSNDKEHHIFCDQEDLDPAALKQFQECLNQPYSVKGALMPDCHLGYTMPIGGVIATKDAVVPSWVGYDIGCGVLSAPISIDAQLIKDNAEGIYHKILRRIPVGYKHRSKRDVDYEVKRGGFTDAGREIWDKKGGSVQLGTLGGGNHFIEIGQGVEGVVYVTIHSGSRGIGHGVASHYIRLAHPEGKLKEGSYPFMVGSQEAYDYSRDMGAALEFAYDNRMQMLNDTLLAINEATDTGFDCVHADIINRNHNHAEYNKESGLWIHRKGATHAEAGMAGVIPGNMRDGVVITEGLGKPESLMSSSHGAGRKMGRKEAKRVLSADFFVDTMADVTCNAMAHHLDESPEAYKDFNEVISQQDGVLFKIIDRVKPIVNVKG